MVSYAAMLQRAATSEQRGIGHAQRNVEDFRVKASVKPQRVGVICEASIQPHHLVDLKRPSSPGGWV